LGYARNFFPGEGSTNSVEDRGQRERGSGGGSPPVRGSTGFANERNPYSDYVVIDVYSTELGIQLSFVRTSEFRGRGVVWTPLGTPLFWLHKMWAGGGLAEQLLVSQEGVYSLELECSVSRSRRRCLSQLLPAVPSDPRISLLLLLLSVTATIQSWTA
jgi:hypothetical protein